MATLNIFVSFEYENDLNLQNSFYRQAKKETNHGIRDCSLHEPYEESRWKSKAREAISGCDVVVVLIGKNTHNAPGIIVETDMARSLGKPIIQVRPVDRTFNGLTRLGEPIPWQWDRINAELDRIANL